MLPFNSYLLKLSSQRKKRDTRIVKNISNFDLTCYWMVKSGQEKKYFLIILYGDFKVTKGHIHILYN